MADDAPPGAMLIVVGATPQVTPLALRERLAVEDTDVAGLLDTLRRAGLKEAVVVATCERTEVFALSTDLQPAADAIAGVLAGHGLIAPAELRGRLLILDGEAAIRHLFTLAAALDSLVVGEPNILGQIKAGWRLAREAGMVGGIFNAHLQAAFAAAKRVRSQTALGTGPASLAAAAVDVARSVHGPLPRCRLLLIGSGEIAELVVRAMIGAGLRQAVVVDPLDVRAAQTAEALDCHVAAFASLADGLADADIVVSALGGRRFAITPPDLQGALRRRRRRPMVLFDCAVPGDLDPAIDAIEEAFRYDLGDLERLARDGQAARRDDLARARALIEADVTAFSAGIRARDAVAAVIALRRCFEAARDAALADAGDDAAKATRLLINRLLHAPTETLKAVARADGGGGDLEHLQRCLDRLFALRMDDMEIDE
ncbi:MAG: glutamyl-tRNA reductase [Rhodospirillales bacterium]|jgi:glutamyl-tRNA reductase|nr:glutamyl-tRNA reductase [Rhodospirillales bacterium]